MKKILVSSLIGLLVLTLSGCSFFEPEAKEFSGNGMTITLNDTFYESESVVFPFYLISVNNIFMGLRETKADAVSVNIDNLREYTELVLENSNHEESVIYESTGENTYLYAYYTATVDLDEYGYMLICMEGASHYYLMNFGCLNTNLEGSKAQFITWANSITVE